MRLMLRVCFALGGLVLIAVGLYYIAFGAVYNTEYVAGVQGICGAGCADTTEQGVSVTYSMYPIWNPPSWNHANLAETCDIVPATYTPQNPPPSCLFAPAFNSPDYSRNYGGIVLIGIGALAGIVAVKSKDEPKEVGATEPNPS